METIGKLLSLIFIAVIGAGGAAMYILDSGKPAIEKTEPIEVEFAEYDANIAKYRDQVRNSYIKFHVPVDRPSTTANKNTPLWTDTINISLPDYITESEVKELADANDISYLREQMNYWHTQYHRALKSNKATKANVAYKKHKSYKFALAYKSRFVN